MDFKDGVLVDKQISELIDKKFLLGNSPIDDDQVQASSFDVSIEDIVFEVEGRIPLIELRRPDVLEKYGQKFEIPESGLILKKGHHYMALPNENVFDLPAGLEVYANPKSSVGRVDLKTTLLNPYRENKILQGENVPYYISLTPDLCDVKIKCGDKFCQLRFIQGNAELSDRDLFGYWNSAKFLYNNQGRLVPPQGYIKNGIIVNADFESDVKAYVAKNVAPVLNFSLKKHYAPCDFFNVVKELKNGELLIKRGLLHLISTKEFISVTPEIMVDGKRQTGFAMEMARYSPDHGSYLSHSAGFFDAGFGWDKNGQIKGTPGTLEVVSYEDLLWKDGEPICRFIVERLSDFPVNAYSGDYQYQRGPKVSKHFKDSC